MDRASFRLIWASLRGGYIITCHGLTDPNNRRDLRSHWGLFGAHVGRPRDAWAPSLLA